MRAHPWSGLSKSLFVAVLTASVHTAAAEGAKSPDPATPPTAPVPTTTAADPGKEVQMAEDPPPNDIEGTNDSPDNPSSDGARKIIAAPSVAPRFGYPIEEVARPLTLPRGTSEVAIDIRAVVSPLVSNATLRARFGITRQWQIGLRYNVGGVYKDPVSGSNGFNVGKAAGLEVSYLITDYIAASVAVPVYLDPVATSINIGAPIRFRFGPKVSLGGLDDLLQIRTSKFVPSFTSELENESRKQDVKTNTSTLKGNLRFVGYGVYQQKANLAFFGRLGVTARDFSSNDLLYLLRAGLQFSPKRFVDLGASIGFDDLAQPTRTFGLELSAAVRI
jgi:hypothetical protein